MEALGDGPHRGQGRVRRRQVGLFQRPIAKGVESIVCLAVNDVFVMGAWGKDQNVGDKVTLVADGSAAFTKAAGLELDLIERGLGLRCQRFSMVVDDGVVKSLNIDAPGTFEATSAEKILEQL